MVRGRTDDQDTLLDYIDKYKPPPAGRVPTPEPPPPGRPETPDPIDKYRLHCWVMVRKGAREVPVTFFLEPTTGYWTYTLTSVTSFLRVRNSWIIWTWLYPLNIHFSPTLSGMICFSVGNFRSSSNKESNNVILYREWILLEAYDYIKNPIIWVFF